MYSGSVTRIDLDRKGAALARRQHGTISRGQLLGLGMSDAQLARRIRSGRLVRAAPGVYTMAGSVRSWHQRLWIAWLHAGPTAVISHRSAAALWKITGFPPGVVELSVLRPAHPRPPEGVLHQLRDLAPSHAGLFDGFRVTKVDRTICDLAQVLPSDKLERALDNAVAAKLTSYVAVSQITSRLLRAGRPWLFALAHLLEARGPGTTPPATELERLLGCLTDLAGIDEVVVGGPFPGRREIGHCVDALVPAAMLILEADGRRWHQRIEDLRRDRLRDNEAARHGWQTMRFLYEDLVEPTESAVALRETYAGRLLLFQSASSRDRHPASWRQ